MTREEKSISPSQKLLTFTNGTQIVVSPFTGIATQWTNDSGAFRAYRLPAEEDTSIRFQAALKELNIIEQETIHLDVTGPGQMRAYHANPRNDQVVIRPTKMPGQPLAKAVKVVLYQDESGGLSWHFPDGFFADAGSSAADSAGTPVLRAAAEPTFT